MLPSVGVAFTTASGNAGSAGFVTTPSGPESHVAVSCVLSWTFVRPSCSYAWRNHRVEGAQAERRRRPVATAGMGAMGSPCAGSSPRPTGKVDAEHRQAEHGRLEQRLLVQAADVRGRLQVVELRLHQCLADRHRARAARAAAGRSRGRAARCTRGSRCRRTGNGPGDQRRPLLRERLRPVERQRHTGQGVVVDEVVAGVAAALKTIKTRFTGEAGQVGREQARREVRRERAVGAEVPGEEDDVGGCRAASSTAERPSRRRCPAVTCPPARTSRSAWAPVPCSSLGFHRSGRVGEEVVAGHERRAGRDDAAHLRVGVEQPGDLAGRLDQAADGQPGHREFGRSATR